jgi:hypothetical protein
MKNELIRFYLIFMLMALALFSCENHDLTQDSSGAGQSTFERKPEERDPVEPNGIQNEGQGDGRKNKKTPRRMFSRSSNLC